MTNTVLLEEILADRGVTKKAMARKLGITPRTIYKIFQGKDITVTQMQIFIEVLKMSKDEMAAVFFPNTVSYEATKLDEV